jgi:geranylgeranyl pyrophosphate synthase
VSDPVDAALARWREAIDAELAAVAESGAGLPPALKATIHYSVTGEGKRLRGLLLMAAYDALGGRGDASAIAAAVEVVHAYSLVHDDLPCMDNDSMRRGRPTAHKAYGVPLATIAGVAMVPLAVHQTLRGAGRMGLDNGTSARLVATLMRASGGGGMVGGQLLDLLAENQSLATADLEAVHRAKTGALITASLAMAGIAAGCSDATLASVCEAGDALGLAFQIADDVLDATASSAALGKTAGIDAALAKSTYVSTLGVQEARDRADRLIEGAMSRLEARSLKTPHLERLARFIAARRS